ncbi:unnamed protein product [Owenia fusiformis]|uniref:Uncharacterized protein n=1 Tax=Owenia fusiformis TaxID=6347 RepID=A0A8J1Y9I1_OWEFU|nr:unnamed protein product [Owenia fusiformis]
MAGMPFVADVSYYPAACISCLFFLFSFKIVSPKLSQTWIPGYNFLAPDKQVEWNSRINSNVHCALVNTMVVYALLMDDELHRDPIWANSAVVKYECAIVVGYMASDQIIMSVYHFATGSEYLLYLLHHGATIYAYYYVMTYSTFPYFANFRLLCEFSTPFVNQRWFMDALGCKRSSPAFIANGLGLTVAFFLVRIASIPFYWHKVYTVYGTDYYWSVGNIHYVMVTSCVTLDILNVFWFSKLLKGARKVLMNKNQNTIQAKMN